MIKTYKEIYPKKTIIKQYNIMKKILENIALLGLLDYCRQNNIECYNSYIYKYPKKYIYSLLKKENGKTIVSVSYYTNKTPLFTYKQ